MAQPVASLCQRTAAAFPCALHSLLWFFPLWNSSVSFPTFPRSFSQHHSCFGLAFVSPLFPSSRHQHCFSVTSPRRNWCQRGTSLLTGFSSPSRYTSFSSVLFPLLACYQHHHHAVTVLKPLVSVQPEACFIPFIKPADSFHFSGTALLSPRRIAACREEGSIAASRGLAALPCWHIQQPVRNHFCWNFWWGRMHIGQDHRIKILPSLF